MTTNAGTHRTRFTIGAEVSCRDGVCGEVTGVVVDPILYAVTHLVVEPQHRVGLGRLVPLDLLDLGSGIQLRCTLAQFEELAAAEETHFLPGTNSYSDYGPGHVVFWPYYGAGAGVDDGPVGQSITSDTLPVGEIAVRRGDRVHAVDGEIGRVQGIVIAQPGHRITHVLLQEGHLFTRKDVAIPISAVTRVGYDIELNLTKQQVQDLPAVDLTPPDRGDERHH